MLSIKPIGSSGQEVGYYANLGQEDYYVKGGEPPGSWCGRGAARLKLTGKVSSENLGSILSGKSIHGVPLVQNAGRKNRRAGFDLTWSVPKSVSVALSQADQEGAKQIEQATQMAVASMLETLEDFCGRSRRGKHGKQSVDAGLVAALFRHDTARGLPGETPDPNLHFHLVVANVSVSEDGSTGALDAKALFEPHMKMALGALFRAELSKNLRALGYLSHRPVDDRGKAKSWFELDAIPVSLTAAFSKRRHQIEHWLKKRGLTGAKAAELAANATRRKKEAFTRDELREAWQKMGSEHGVSNETLREAREAGLASLSAVVKPEEIMTKALELITEDRARFSKVELIRFAAQEAQTSGLGISDIRQVVDKTLARNQEIVRLKSIAGIPQFTTREMLTIERQLLETAEHARSQEQHLVGRERAEATINLYDTLRAEQAQAVKHLTGQPGMIACVNGMAGTGKTFLLTVARDVWQSAGFRVLGTALAAKAAMTLEEEAGIESTHLHRLLYELENGKRVLSSDTVVVLDEAAMVGTRMLNRLVQAIDRAGAKLAMIGDHRQLQAISAGAPFRVLAEQLGVVELTDVTRQREPWARETVKELAAGKAESALERLHAHGDLIIRRDRDEATEQLVADWHVDFTRGLDARIFAGTRLETSIVNRLCQRVRLAASELGTQSIEVGRNRLFVNDRIVVTKNDRIGVLKNGMTGTLTGMDSNAGILKIKLDTGICVQLAVAEFEHLELGYCTTTHKGQGQTVDSAFVLAGGVMTDREITYVQGSRARGRTRFYTDAESGGDTISTLAARMNRSRQKDLAHEYAIEAV